MDANSVLPAARVLVTLDWSLPLTPTSNPLGVMLALPSRRIQNAASRLSHGYHPSRSHHPLAQRTASASSWPPASSLTLSKSPQLPERALKAAVIYLLKTLAWLPFSLTVKTRVLPCLPTPPAACPSSLAIISLISATTFSSPHSAPACQLPTLPSEQFLVQGLWHW